MNNITSCAKNHEAIKGKLHTLLHYKDELTRITANVKSIRVPFNEHKEEVRLYMTQNNISKFTGCDNKYDVLNHNATRVQKLTEDFLEQCIREYFETGPGKQKTGVNPREMSSWIFTQKANAKTSTKTN